MHMEVKKEQTKEVDSAQPSFLSHGGGTGRGGGGEMLFFFFLFKASLDPLTSGSSCTTMPGLRFSLIKL